MVDIVILDRTPPHDDQAEKAALAYCLTSGKIPEAQTQFEQAVKLDPNLAEAHYWLGMALVNAGKSADAKTHFEEYLKLAPTGQYAETAKNILASIK